MHVSAESVTCGVTVANFGVLGFLWNDCTESGPDNREFLASTNRYEAAVGPRVLHFRSK